MGSESHNAMSTSSKRRSTHVVICTSGGKGHLTPAVMLSRKLASLGMSITLICPDQATKLLITTSTLCEGFDIVLKSLEDNLMNKEQQNTGNATKFTLEMAGVRVGVSSSIVITVDALSHKEKHEELLLEMQSSASPPVCLIVDMIFTWSKVVASKLGIPRFVLFSGAPNQLPVFLHMRTLYDQGILPIPQSKPEVKKEVLDKLRLPGLPMLLRWNDIPDAVTDSSHSFHNLHMGWLEHLLEADGLLFNTFLDLEGVLFDALRSYIPSSLLLPIGPLFPDEYFTGDPMWASKRSPLFQSSEQDKIEQWLDTQKNISVVYISFGSYASLMEKQVKELACGLECSQQKFLWVLSAKNEEVLPPGFLERNAANGLVVSDWAPQHLILSHPSVGAFLTHCGWNSTLECITLAGVPMICWPFFVDQQPNCRYIVDGLGIGVDVHSDEEGFVPSHEVEVAIRAAMEGPDSHSMRSKATVLQAAAKNAVAEGGSSVHCLDTLVSRLCSL